MYVAVCQLSAPRTVRVAMAQASFMVQYVGQACKAKARLAECQLHSMQPGLAFSYVLCTSCMDEGMCVQAAGR